jgi:hypothetical protein
LLTIRNVAWPARGDLTFRCGRVALCSFIIPLGFEPSP